MNLFNLAPDAIDQFFLPLGWREPSTSTRTPGRMLIS